MREGRNEERRRMIEGRHEKRRWHEEFLKKELSRRISYFRRARLHAPRAPPPPGPPFSVTTSLDPRLVLRIDAARRNGRRACALLFGLEIERPAGRPAASFSRASWAAACAAASASRACCSALAAFGLPGLGARSRLRLAFSLTPLHLGIVRSRLGAKLVQDVLLRLQGGLLTVGEIRFLESTHKRGLVAFISGVTRGIGRFRALVGEAGAKYQRPGGVAKQGRLAWVANGRNRCR